MDGHDRTPARAGALAACFQWHLVTLHTLRSLLGLKALEARRSDTVSCVLRGIVNAVIVVTANRHPPSGLLTGRPPTAVESALTSLSLTAF